MLPTCACNLAIDLWKGETLSAIAGQLVRPLESDTQKGIGMWERSSGIPFPTSSQVHVLGNGCLVVNFYAGAHLVALSVWVMFGEIRIGIKIPHVYASTPEMLDRYARLYDGNASMPRRKHLAHSILIDWIFHDSEFAEFKFMTAALEKPLLAAVIVDRVAQICKHIYLAVTDTLVDVFNAKISLEAPEASSAIEPEHGGVSVAIHFRGDDEALFHFIVTQCCGVVTSVTRSGSACVAEATLNFQGKCKLRTLVGHWVGDMDGGEFMIDSLCELG